MDGADSGTAYTVMASCNCQFDTTWKSLNEGLATLGWPVGMPVGG